MSEIKLIGKSKSGREVSFSSKDINDYIEIDNGAGVDYIDPATIQLADDQRKDSGLAAKEGR